MTPVRAAPVVPVQVLAGILAAALLGLADALQCLLDRSSPRVHAGEALVGALHLIALHLPLGLTAAIAGTALTPVLRSVAWLAPVRRRLSPGRLFAPDPAGFAGVLSLALGAAALYFAADHAFVDFHGRFHREDLAAAAFGAVMLATLVVVALLASLVARGLAALGRHLGAGASTGVALVVVVLSGAIVAAVTADANEDVVRSYGWITLLWPPLGLVLWIGSIMAVSARAPRIRSRRLWDAAAVATALAVLAPLISAFLYGGSNRVRSVVEQRAVLGRRLVRGYASVADADQDGYTWAFGGGDCDDGDPEVNPGAIDAAGDGVDSDCTGRDGAPDVAPRGDGRFGRSPLPMPHPNILVITVDALRRDHLGFHGYRRPTSPNMDRFLAQSVDFEGVLPQSSRSIRSIPSMWTGEYASEVAYGPEYLYPAIRPENVYAPELLRDRAGYLTAAVMASNYFARSAGFFQGFDELVQLDVYDPPRDRAVNDALPILQRFAAQQRPWLLWVHLFNCHVPYLQDGIRSPFGSDPVDMYDHEIQLADAQVQRLLTEVDRLGLRETTVVLLASDHGEAFGEHGTYGHASSLYEEELLSVMAIRAPGVAPRRVPSLVGLLDLGPTVLNFAGVPPPSPISGHSLLPLMTAERAPDPERTVFAELMPDGLFPHDVKVLRRGSTALMWWVRDGTVQLFDLERDPRQRNDLSDSRPELRTRLLEELRAWVARVSRPDNRNDLFVAQHRLRQIPRMTHPLRIEYPGMFTVVGYDFPRTRFARGERMPLTFYYTVQAPIDRDLFFLVGIEGPPGYALPMDFHAWHHPLHSRYPTTRWRRGEILRDPTPIVIPPDLRPGRYQLTFGVRDGSRMVEALSTGRRITRVQLSEFEVTAAASPQ